MEANYPDVNLVAAEIPIPDENGHTATVAGGWRVLVNKETIEADEFYEIMDGVTKYQQLAEDAQKDIVDITPASANNADENGVKKLNDEMDKKIAEGYYSYSEEAITQDSAENADTQNTAGKSESQALSMISFSVISEKTFCTSSVSFSMFLHLNSFVLYKGSVIRRLSSKAVQNSFHMLSSSIPNAISPSLQLYVS